MDIVLSSRNKKKIAELRKLLDDSGITDVNLLSLNDIGVVDDIEENGTSFEENSLIKASVPSSLGYIGIADDSGLCVDVLNGAPGIYSARYSGENASDSTNNAKLRRELEGYSLQERTAHFVCVISCVIPRENELSGLIPAEYDVSEEYSEIIGDSKAFCVLGKCDGLILDSPRGDNGFGYDPLFYIPDKDKTFAQLPAEEKNEISHRGKAMKELTKVLNIMMRGRNA